ncbi:MAG: HET domain protein [Mycoplasmataceae bacterium RV_VA103A]|nr:MAG: HET domain protein [Mycoplasmataceae bacterium RV_VA103A]
MVNAQEWLDKNYPKNNCPKKERSEIYEIYLNEPSLSGELDLGDFTITWTQLKVYISLEVDETKLEIKNLPKKAEIIKLVNAQEYINQKYPTKEKREQVKGLYIRDENLEGELDLSDFNNLEELDCSCNKLINLDCSNLIHLEGLYCNDNYLTKIIYPTNPEKLTYLEISDNNFPEQNLTCFRHLIHLQRLEVGNPNLKWENKCNRFIGSLEPLKNLTKLKELRILNTDIDSGLEYLPDCLESLACYSSTHSIPQRKATKIYEELLFYGWRLKTWKEANPELMIKAWGKFYSSTYKNQLLEAVATIPYQFFNQDEVKLEENHNLEKIKKYSEVVLRDNRPFSWEKTNQSKSQLPKSLPIKLYNIKTNRVEWTANNLNIKSYATLSYVWGSTRDKKIAEEMKMTYQRGSEIYEEELTITKWGKKSLIKAIAACKFLGIDYLWIDQLCINQKDREEKAEEVRKMRKCYGEGEATLISINADAKDKVTHEESKEESVIEILKKVISSQWFTRSWTFQEGWLSKQTIFMFDDVLIDGRMMAQVWAVIQQVGHPEENLNKEPRIFVTPLGWTYYKQRDDHWDQVNLWLSQSLIVIKKRGRGNPIDGIYSVLGLLPYGEKVKVDYSLKPEQALLETMKTSVEAGHDSEILSWHGSRRNRPYLWWIPEIDEKGSTNLRGWIDIVCEPKSAEFTESGIKLIGSQRSIKALDKTKSIHVFQRTEDMVGLLMVYVFTGDSRDYSNSIALKGSKETLEKIKEEDTLVIFSKEKWKIKNNEKYGGLAILVPSVSNFDCPVDMMELDNLEDRRWNFLKLVEKELFVDMVNKKITELEEQELQPQIQILPKN